jgi:hypothetical protein
MEPPASVGAEDYQITNAAARSKSVALWDLQDPALLVGAKGVICSVFCRLALRTDMKAATICH